MDELLSNISRIYQSLAGDSKVSLVCDFTHLNYHYIITDKLRYQQLISNLLSNAIKFSGDNSTVNWIISDQLSSERKIIQTITIQDFGCGMSEDFLKQIFFSFTQEDNIYSTSTTGTGLGLVIAKEIARLLHIDPNHNPDENHRAIIRKADYLKW